MNLSEKRLTLRMHSHLKTFTNIGINLVNCASAGLPGISAPMSSRIRICRCASCGGLGCNL